MGILKMAWRNLWRNRRRSMVTVAAMSFALFILILYSGMVEGMLVGMERDVLDLELGDLQIHGPGYLDNPSIYTRIDDVENLLTRLDGAGFQASPRLLAGGLAASDETSAGVVLRGIDVAREATVSIVHERVGQGKWLDPAVPDAVVLGRRLAQTLELDLGDEVMILSQGADGSIANALYQVRGVLGTVSDGTDRAAIFMTTEAFRDLMVVPVGVHQIVVRRPKGSDLESSLQEVELLAVGLDVQSWAELMPAIATMLESTRGLIFVVFFIVYIAIGILILNAMLMAVFERIRELGVLKALGMEPYRILALIAAESALQAGLAIFVGVGFSLPGMWYLSRTGIDVGSLGGIGMGGLVMRPVWYGIFDLNSLPGPILLLLFIVSLAVLYPALKAAFIHPVEAMRHQ